VGTTRLDLLHGLQYVSEPVPKTIELVDNQNIPRAKPLHRARKLRLPETAAAVRINSLTT
jgi:hypothetical protein